MNGAKPCNTPITLQSNSEISNIQYSLDDAQSFIAIVGALHFLTFRGPNIAFAISKLRQTMYNPSTFNLTTTKGVLRYLAGTLL